jgi:hypothetical protein
MCEEKKMHLALASWSSSRSRPAFAGPAVVYLCKGSGRMGEGVRVFG